ncbi:MAG: shikimate dehydrogenase [Bacteroidetes bacterium]|nr:shikimate dehydrogenase [Bacteroidota bacterium]
MRKFGLIGYPLSHSFSQKYFEEKFRQQKITDCSYDLFPLKTIDSFPSLIKSHAGLSGLNVTIPYKESVLDFLHETDKTAQEIGAVNCIHIKDGKLAGYNTDAIGFELSLKNFLSSIPQHAFVLGTGGSSKAVRFILHKMQIPFSVISRSAKDGALTYQEISGKMKASNLFINCTPAGMYPDIDLAPAIPYEELGTQDFLYDLVYNPAETLFLKKGKEKGAKTKNGLEMLELQAEESWRIWNQ